MSLSPEVIEELDALEQLFEENCSIDTSRRRGKIHIADGGISVDIDFELLDDYPGKSLPRVTIGSSDLDGLAISRAHELLKSMYVEGEVVLFQFAAQLYSGLDGLLVEDAAVRGIENAAPRAACATADANGITKAKQTAADAAKASMRTAAPALKIFRGKPIVDRKSKFVPFAARVSSVEYVEAFREEVLSDKHVAAATHNMLAYRVGGSATRPLFEDADDDGESGAGTKMMFLLRRLDVRDVAVIVTRWYGGIQLGPDRFKHIANAVRQVVVDNGLEKHTDTEEQSQAGHLLHRSTHAQQSFAALRSLLGEPGLDCMDIVAVFDDDQTHVSGNDLYQVTAERCYSLTCIAYAGETVWP